MTRGWASRKNWNSNRAWTCMNKYAYVVVGVAQSVYTLCLDVWETMYTVFLPFPCIPHSCDPLIPVLNAFNWQWNKHKQEQTNYGLDVLLFMSFYKKINGSKMFYYLGTKHAQQWILQTCLNLLETLQFPDVSITFTCSQYKNYAPTEHYQPYDWQLQLIVPIFSSADYQCCLNKHRLFKIK